MRYTVYFYLKCFFLSPLRSIDRSDGKNKKVRKISTSTTRKKKINYPFRRKKGVLGFLDKEKERKRASWPNGRPQMVLFKDARSGSCRVDLNPLYSRIRLLSKKLLLACM